MHVFQFCFSEGESDVWYYSSRYQIDELLEVLDKDKWERDLAMCIREMREEMVRQMMITEDLTNSNKGTRKSAIDIEIGTNKAVFLLKFLNAHVVKLLLSSPGQRPFELM